LSSSSSAHIEWLAREILALSERLYYAVMHVCETREAIDQEHLLYSTDLYSPDDGEDDCDAPLLECFAGQGLGRRLNAPLDDLAFDYKSRFHQACKAFEKLPLRIQFELSRAMGERLSGVDLDKVPTDALYWDAQEEIIDLKPAFEDWNSFEVGLRHELREMVGKASVDNLDPPGEAAVDQSGGDGSPTTSMMAHNDDFTSVNINGDHYTFTVPQSKVIRLLYEAWKDGFPDVESVRLLQVSGSDSNRLKNVFSRHEAWGKLVIKTPGSKSKHRLNVAP